MVAAQCFPDYLLGERPQSKSNLEPFGWSFPSEDGGQRIIKDFIGEEAGNYLHSFGCCLLARISSRQCC